MQESLEYIIKDFKVGYRIADQLYYDCLHPEHPKYRPQDHDTHIKGMANRPEQIWEAAGFLTGVVKNAILRPYKDLQVVF